MRERKNSPYNVLNPNGREHMNIITRLKALCHREHESTVEIVEIIESLVQCNREKAYLEHGCSTLWDFLVREMNYSNAAASRRYKAMKCAERFPQVLGMLRRHQLSLSTLAQAESLLGEVNDPQELLDRLAGKSHREVERVVALERPLPRKPKEIVRRVAVKAKNSGMPLLEAPAKEPVEEPVEERVTLRTSLSAGKFEAFEATRDQGMLRDKQRCTFRSRLGRTCNSTHNLQIDHIKPFALGGTHDAQDLRVLCAAHNRHVARKIFNNNPLPAPEQSKAGLPQRRRRVTAK
jgi:hypothetical protein